MYFNITLDLLPTLSPNRKSRKSIILALVTCLGREHDASTPDAIFNWTLYCYRTPTAIVEWIYHREKNTSIKNESVYRHRIAAAIFWIHAVECLSRSWGSSFAWTKAWAFWKWSWMVFETITKRNPSTKVWKQILGRLEDEMRLQVLRYGKLSDLQVDRCAKKAIAAGEEEERLYLKKCRGKARSNQSTWKHRSLEAMKVNKCIVWKRWF